MSFDIETKPRREEDVTAALAEVNASPFIGGWSRGELDSHLKADAIRFFYEDDNLAGISAWILFDEDRWCELGPFFAMDAFRGRGLGKLLMVHAIEYNRDLGRNLYGVTKNDIVKKVFTQNGLGEVSMLALPMPIKRYLIGKLNPGRLWNNLRKVNAHDTVAHYIERTAQP